MFIFIFLTSLRDFIERKVFGTKVKKNNQKKCVSREFDNEENKNKREHKAGRQ